VLVVGSSMGYGLASRIAAAFGSGANTLGVAFDRAAAGTRTATAGWYNTAAFEDAAHKAGLYAKTINADAFSQEAKDTAIETIKNEMGKIDLVVYSLASPRRTHPQTGEVFNSVIKPIGEPFTNKTLAFHTGEVQQVTIEPASGEEIRQTVAVMGGEDWGMWMDALQMAGVLADGVTAVAYSYLGPSLTWPVYKDGTIGRAKEDLDATAKALNQKLASLGGRAYISMNKALVTQSSSAIPVVPLYISILYKTMKEMGLHEGCIEQMDRMLRERLYAPLTPTDEKGRIRMDDWEMGAEVQEAVMRAWAAITTENAELYADRPGFHQDFFDLFGFYGGLDTAKDVNPDVAIPGLVNLLEG